MGLLGPPRYATNGGLRVRISDDARKAVVFFGIPGPNGIEYAGTGFMMTDMQDGIDMPFLVTARHVARHLEKFHDVGFFIRANTRDGRSHELPVEHADWAYHPDPTVDLAAVMLTLTKHVYDILYFPIQGSVYGPEDRVRKYGTGDDALCGDPIAIVGLFRLHKGSEKNVPIVHSGHIAALPDPNERIPVRDRITKQLVNVEAFLVEAQTLDGLSGSPVFTVENLQLGIFDKIHGDYPSAVGAMSLLGLYVGAWDGEPGQILAADRDLKGGIRVPVGMGIVVPAAKILELVREHPGLIEARRKRVEIVKSAVAANQDAAFPEPAPKATLAEPAKGEPNPNHKEAFTSLLNAASKKNQPAD